MGGHKRKGQAQRTKNNARPANSSRIAELIESQNYQLGGFSSLKDPIGLPSGSGLTALTTLSFDPNIDPAFLIVLKKMNKKDATTRYKALQELIALCKSGSEETVTEVLPAWVRVYNRLAVDVEHRVREAVQQAHRAIVAKVGRNLAPHLKQVAPLWFISQYDTYAPAATSASLAFQEAFPPHKVSEVIVFCQNEILKYIEENLLNLTPQNVSKGGEMNKDQMQAKYERIIICSLNGYALFLSKVKKDEIEKNSEINKAIISSPKFWKLAKYKMPVVRSAWFSLLTSLCQNAPFLLENEQKHVMNTVLGSIDDYDGAVLSNVWEATLHCLTSIKNCWDYVNLDKFFLPKLCSILKHGGQGNASNIFPNIIIVLSSIPQNLIKNKQIFYGKVFTSFLEGMKQPMVFQSSTESESVATSFTECIRYFTMIHIEDIEFCNFLLEEHLLAVMSGSMVEASFRHLITPLYSAVSHMLVQWHKNDNANYSLLRETFWTRLSSICVDNLRASVSDQTQLSHLLSCQIKMLDLFKIPKIGNKKKQLKVTFAMDPKPKEFTDRTSIRRESQEESSNIPETEEKRMITFAKMLFQSCYRLAVESEDKSVRVLAVQQLSCINTAFNRKLSLLVESVTVDHWFSSLRAWLHDQEMPRQYVLQLIFSSETVLQPDPQVSLIPELTKHRSGDNIKEALKLSLTSMDPPLKNWLSSDAVKTEICRIYETLDEAVEVDSFDVFKHCLFASRQGEFIIGTEAVQALLGIVERHLNSSNEAEVRKGCRLVDTLFTNLTVAAEVLTEQLILNLLQSLFRNIVHGRGALVLKTWEKGVVFVTSQYDITNEHLQQHLKNCAHLVGQVLRSGASTVDFKSIYRAVVTLISFLVQHDPERMLEVGIPSVRQFISSALSDEIKEVEARLEEVVLCTEAIHGRVPYHDGFTDNSCCVSTGAPDRMDPLWNLELLSLVRSMLFVVRLLSILLDIHFREENEDEVELEEDEPMEASMPPITPQHISQMCDYIIELTSNLALLNAFQQYYYTTKQYFDAANYLQPVENSLKEVIQRLEPAQQENLVAVLTDKCSKLGKHWPRTKTLLAVDFLGGTVEINEVCEEAKQISIEELHSLEINQLRNLREKIERNAKLDIDLYETFYELRKNYKLKFSSALDHDLSEANADTLLVSAEMANLCSAFLQGSFSRELDVNAWDFFRISVTAWLHSISMTNPEHPHLKELATMTVAVCRLLSAISSKLASDEVLEKYRNEWKGVFVEEAHLFLGTSWHNFSEKMVSGGVNYVVYVTEEALSRTLTELIGLDSVDCCLHLTYNKFHTWLQYGLSNIVVPFSTIQLTAARLLTALVPLMKKSDEGLDDTSLEHISCSLLETTFIETQTVVLAMLQDFSVGICCSVEPFTDSYTYTLAYLQLWSVLLHMCKEGDSQERYLYPLWIREKQLISNFMEAVIKLMPVTVLQEGVTKKIQELFRVPPPFSFDGWGSGRLSHLASWLLSETLRIIPAVARLWVSEADPRSLSFLDRIVTTYISPALCAKEMEDIKAQQSSFENMKVVTHGSVREVVATYTVEEVSSELIIQLAPNHPLAPPKVDTFKAMVSSVQNRQWLKQLTIFLTHQNGSIWDGLLHWKNNLDKKFEGIEECYVCFSILHNTTHQLPKLSCSTCKKKFHSFCLFKWFSTSHKSTCPICRAIF